MVHKKKNKKTNNGPQEKEQKDKQWSTIKRAKRQTMHCLSFCSFSCGPLFVFLLLFLWTIVCLLALFVVDHCFSFCSFSCGPLFVFLRTKRQTMVHKKKNKKKNNGPQEKEQKDKQWSTIKKKKRTNNVCCGPLFFFLFFFLWTIFCLLALFIVDHCFSFCSFSCGPLFVFNGPQ
jgi:F0F1-type ATP synthase assembly protein I